MTTQVPASLAALVKVKQPEAETPEQIQARLQAQKDADGQQSEVKKDQEQEQVTQAQAKNLVKFAAFRASMKTFTLHLGGGQVVNFFNHEAYIQVNSKNATILDKLSKIIEEEPEMGISVGLYGGVVEVDPVELQQQRRQAELNLFLSEKTRRMAPVQTHPDQFTPASSDASPLTKGNNTGTMRFSNVDLASAQGNK